jgi:SAM-dependent methyltransferase
MAGPCRSDLNPSAYDAFAPFYDGFTSASDYELWTDQVLELAARHGMAGRAALDLACGTGNSFVPLLRRGFSVTGCDASPAMLAEAAIKAPGIRLLRADLRRLPALGRFDLVTCVDDSLNYLLDGDELLAAFHGMAANLDPRGVAVFDLNSIRAYRTTFARDATSESDGHLFAWRGETADDAPPGCLAAAVIEIFAVRDDGLYERVTTRHEQRHFPRGEVMELLDAARLECVAVHGALDSGELVEQGDEDAHLKVLYIAKPVKGGAAK